MCKAQIIEFTTQRPKPSQNYHQMLIISSMFIILQKNQRRQLHAVKETEFLRLKRSRLGVEDFESLRVIGKGAFGEVRIYKCLTFAIQKPQYNMLGTSKILFFSMP